ncbi:MULTISPECIES: hypothetical protein [Chitinophagaceae]|uniref:hypothetical protein n=1 Tax=Chitinophagaceae TaxID=563835 RepID=UPI000F4E039D|nr:MULTISPECIES: hypothetical protein [Chitinophagaceae]RPD51408.1 hypothetical protein DRJ53_01620 [Paracnuella aquatica]
MKQKNIFAAFAMAAFALTSCGDNNDIAASEVPAAVMSSFNSKYTNVTNAEWEKEERNGATVYEVDFRANNKEIKAIFDTNGGLIESKGD